ncbi:hypothetical protein HD554DRAFT_2041835 [Boletus coccyginus]|nr:hypothetical protein HD554DRAFT_2041835 [Boletus coccyginus]
MTYVCNLCATAFPHAEALRRHRSNTHSADATITLEGVEYPAVMENGKRCCPFPGCDKNYEGRDGLRKHMKAHLLFTEKSQGDKLKSSAEISKGESPCPFQPGFVKVTDPPFAFLASTPSTGPPKSKVSKLHSEAYFRDTRRSTGQRAPLALSRRHPTLTTPSGAEGAGSLKLFVKGLFSDMATATQAHPKDEGARSSRSSQCTLRPLADNAAEEQDREDEDPSSGPTPCIAGEFRAVSDALFGTLSEAQHCQLEGRSVKGQIRSLGLTEVSKRKANVFEAGVWFSGNSRFSLFYTTWVLLSEPTFHCFEDRIRFLDVEEQERNRLRDAEAEAGIDVRSIGGPYAPCASPGLLPDSHANPSTKRLPRLTPRSWPTPLHPNAEVSTAANTRAGRTSSNCGSESYAPSRIMFQHADKEGLAAKEALAGEIMEGETTEATKETLARRRCVLAWGMQDAAGIAKVRRSISKNVA